MDFIGQTKLFFDEIISSKKVIIAPDYREPMAFDKNNFKWTKEFAFKRYGIVIGSEYSKFSCMDSTRIAWSCPGADFIYGGFRINGFIESLVEKSDFWKIDFSLGPSDEVPEELKHFEKLNWFDRQAWGDDERFGCYIREEGTFPPRLAFFDHNWYTELSLSLEEYFEALFKSFGVKGWQYFYIDWEQEIPHKEEGLKDMELAVKYLPKFFPEKDFSYHKTKLEEVKGM